MKIERLFSKDPQLKYNKFRFIKDENSKKNITTNKITMQNLKKKTKITNTKI